MRLDVRKTYKLFIGGAFPRSESGRSYELLDSKGNFLANPALASRKDLRDAVVAARNAADKWAGATAFNRSQILYRVAEMMEGRREQFVAEIMAQQGVTKDQAAKQVGATKSQQFTAQQIQFPVPSITSPPRNPLELWLHLLQEALR